MNRPDRFDLVDTLAALYLAVPVLLFCLGWLQPLAAALLVAALAVLMLPFLRPVRAALGWRWAVGAVVLALAWSVLGGAGHILYANPYDWNTRDAVLRDLAVLPWPVYYATDGIAAVALRAPIGYYLAPSALAKLFGVGSADKLLYLWTAAGVALFACLSLQATADRRHRLVWLLLLPWFSGMDAIGWWMEKGHFAVGQHIEWWALFHQYSSNATLLFWAPNHALPAWLAAGWLLKHWSRSTMLPAAALLIAVLPLWAPLLGPALGVIGVAWCIAHPERLKALGGLPGLLLVAGLAVGICTGLWISSGTAGSVPAGITIAAKSPFSGLMRVIRFDLVEWAVIGFLVWRIVPRALAVPTALLLALLPIFRLGLANDLVMRASIIPLAVLWWYAAKELVAGPLQASWARTAIAGLLLVGAITPAQEVLRALREPRWQPDLAHSLPEKFPLATQPHYLVDATSFSPFVTQLLQAPSAANTFTVPRKQ
jgi:hypothetical protein